MFTYSVKAMSFFECFYSLQLLDTSKIFESDIPLAYTVFYTVRLKKLSVAQNNDIA